jgi:hypothetical protein
MPTTTNLSITYPASSDFVTNGATAMGTIATGIDAFFGAFTTYTPTLGNVSGGATSGRFVNIGKIGFFRATITAGTATAGGSITISLPTGWTIQTAFNQLVDGANVNSCYAVIATGTPTVVSVFKDSDATNWTAGNSVASVRVQGWVELA